MSAKDTNDVVAALAAVAGDAAAFFAGCMFAVWLRFDSGLIPMFHDRPPPHIYGMYAGAAAVATFAAVMIFSRLGLYSRPQTGVFSEKIPRLLRATVLSCVAAMVLAFVVRTEPPISRVALAVAAPSIFILLLLERHFLFQWELAVARRAHGRDRVLVIGTDVVASRLMSLFETEPRLHSEVVGFIEVEKNGSERKVPERMVLGGLDRLEECIKKLDAGRVIFTGAGLPHDRILEVMMICERNMAVFNMVPDLYQLMTGSMNMQHIGDIPLLGAGRWPLDRFWNRLLKRTEDILGAVVGLVFSALPCAVIAWLIKRDSPGPVFYRQERCGEGGRTFVMYKFRTMRVDAEAGGEPGWTTENDPRRTRAGAWLRRWNLDELPQLWNVLKGDMSLVGPRPERPFYVEQFKEDIRGYMRRHAYKPGMTGWAQVNGLRGNSDLRERLKYDLYYLENWSLAFDFKILAKTLFARKNAY